MEKMASCVTRKGENGIPNGLTEAEFTAMVAKVRPDWPSEHPMIHRQSIRL